MCIFLGAWGWFLPPNFHVHFFWVGMGGFYLPFFFFHTGDSPFIFGVLVPSFPPPLGLASTFISPFPHFLVQLLWLVVKLGPLHPLEARMGFSMMFIILCVMPFLVMWHVSSLATFVDFSSFVFLVVLLAPYPPPMAWAWVLEVNPLGTFHLGFLRPCLYFWILFV